MDVAALGYYMPQVLKDAILLISYDNLRIGHEGLQGRLFVGDLSEGGLSIPGSWSSRISIGLVS